MAAPKELPNARAFTWRDGPRTVHFGDGTLGEVPRLLADHGWEDYELMTTARALGAAPMALPEGATALHYVPGGKVADVSAALLEHATGSSIVALGGGRVIDAAKAVAAVRGGRVAAVPTTLSGAELTRIHRLPEGHSAPRLVRPELVFADPVPMTSLGEEALRATAMNALAHGADALFGPTANPFSTQAGLHGGRLIARAMDSPAAGRDRSALALGSLFCAYAIDGAGLSLHHAVCQELVRGLGMPHAETNATMLPLTMEAMIPREPAAMTALARAVLTKRADLRERLTELGGGPRRLRDLGGDRSQLDEALDSIHGRIAGAMREPLDREELTRLVEAAW